MFWPFILLAILIASALYALPAPDSLPAPLFWQWGASLFAGSEIWARLFAPLFSIATLVLTPSLTRRLWPDRRETAPLAPVLLVALPLFLIYAGLSRSGNLATFFTTLGLLGMCMVWRNERVKGGFLYALAVSLGLLAAGPTILFFLLPPVLFIRTWLPRSRLPAKFWYGALSIGLIIGLAAAFAWALAAVVPSARALTDRLLFPQTGAARHAGWWYLAILPLILFPWIWSPRVWRIAADGWRSSEPGLRLCLLSILIPLIGFSLIPAKAAVYLMPLTVPLALMAARAVADARESGLQRTATLVAILAAAGAVLALLLGNSFDSGNFIPLVPQLRAVLPATLQNVTPWSGLGLLLVAVAALFWRPRTRFGGAHKIAVLMWAVSLVSVLEAGRAWD